MTENSAPPKGRARLQVVRVLYLLVLAGLGAALFHWNRTRTRPNPPSRSVPDSEFLSLFEGPADSLPGYLAPYHANEEFREAFPQDVPPPRLDTTLDLERFSLEQIRYLRGFVLARHGFLFRDLVLRAFFGRFAWYQPIWIPEDFQVRLAPWERRWHDRLLQREKLLAQGNYLEDHGVKRAALDHLVDRMTFDSIPSDLLAHLDTAGFAILSGHHNQLWNVYDKNQYDGIASIVTPDLFLQLLHMRFKYLVKSVERERLVRDLGTSLAELRTNLGRPMEGIPQEDVDNARAVVDVGLALLQGSEVPLQDLPEGIRERALADYRSGTAAKGFGCLVLGDTLFDWSQLSPRGHYASSDTLSRYFRAFRWIAGARWPLSPGSFPTTLALGRAWMACGPRGPEGLARIGAFLDAFSGPPNGLSPQDLVEEARNMGHADLAMDYGRRRELEGRLHDRDPARIHARGGNDIAAADLSRAFLRILPLRWSGDAEILQRLVNLDRDASGRPVRPFPSGLDVFAARGDDLARSIVLDGEDLDRIWPAWKDTLKELRATAALRGGTDFHSRRIRLLESLREVPAGAPPFQRTELWKRHLLVTRLGSWTLQKQENVLYQEQALAAECGEGGGPPPPDPTGWVDPNTAFWDGAGALVESLDSLLLATGLSSRRNPVDSELVADFRWLSDASRRELESKPLTRDQLERILWIGGHVESLTFRITEIEPQVFQQSEEAMAAAATDVYSWNGTPLLEGTGYADELWAIVEIGGFLHLARGAVLSHREWVGKERLTDRQWHRTLESGAAPEIPAWQRPLFSPSRSPGTLPTTSSLLPFGGCF